MGRNAYDARLMTISIAILGATGYTGAELIRLIEAHPEFTIAHLSAHSQAGKRLGDVLPHVSEPLADMTLQSADTKLSDDVQLVFAALPHGAAAESVAAALKAGKKVVDLSADFRHKSADTYAKAYGQAHHAPEYLDEAVYGLTEYARDAVKQARLVANPGCYPTSTLLPLIPLLKAGVLSGDKIIVDSKSGASGAGRGVKTELLFCDVNEGVQAYGLPVHRHSFEMEEWALGFSGKGAKVRFVPHILPMNRGMLTTLHLSGTDASGWHSILSEKYANEPFVRIMPEGKLPSTQGVSGSNRCDIGVVALSDSEAVIVSCIDNLLKGASGQAVQNANLMSALDETLGIPTIAAWP